MLVKRDPIKTTTLRYKINNNYLEKYLKEYKIKKKMNVCIL